jgi:diguanylate cyclase
MNKEFETILSKLSEDERNEAKLNNLDIPEKLIPLLLKRVHPQNVQQLAALIKQSVLPSICPKTDDEIDKLFSKIEKEPNLLFIQEIQDKIEDFINKRFERDKRVVIERTSDISKLVLLMEEYLNEAISSNGSSSKNVLNIKEKIQSINIQEDGLEALTKLQNELINAASSIEKEMITVTNKLETGKTKVQELEEKVKTLEDELTRTKTENMKDHLTGLLTRRAFSDEIKRIESAYERIKTQYAVVFFDLDHFKKLNDTYGHECGDVVLSTFGKILNKTVREHDLVGRYGGEEFVAVIHFNLNRELLQFLKRIKTIVTENSFLYKDKKIKVTFSAGVAIRSSYDTYENTLQKADMLLYQAKENGRNKIILENGMEI